MENINPHRAVEEEMAAMNERRRFFLLMLRENPQLSKEDVEMFARWLRVVPESFEFFRYVLLFHFYNSQSVAYF